MKVLILNGSPRRNGDTDYILKLIKQKLPSDVVIDELFTYKENIKPCIDCRYCWKNEGCFIKDRMVDILKDDYDLLLVASPVFMSNLTPPLFSIITRLNMKWCNKHFLGNDIVLRRKKGILVLVGGGSGAPTYALKFANILFKGLNVEFDINKNYIYSLNTDNIPVKDDDSLLLQIDNVIKSVIE